MITRKISRLNKNGKSSQEKEGYRKFISSDFKLDKTEPDPIDTNKTSESSYKEDGISKIEKTTKKSFKLSAKDFLSNNLTASIIGGIIVFIICAIGSFLIEICTSQKIQDFKIADMEKNIQSIKDENSGNRDGMSQLKQNIEIFKIEISKEIEFIKDKITNLNKQ